MGGTKMKEILFRGKALKSYKNLPFVKNGWIYGQYVEVQHSIWHEVNEKGEDITLLHPAIFVTVKHEKGLNGQDWLLVKPESIGQYTGKNDIEGNMIFNHDIVSLNGKTYEVFYDKSEAAYHLRYFAGIVRGIYDNVVVVGNTTDNPELLEGIK
jgi:hypothetical protein